MQEMWKSFVDVLDETQELYSRLLDYGEEKKTLLIKSRPTELEALNRLEEALVAEGKKLEHRRAKATADIITTHGLSNARPTITELMELADSKTAERLKEFNTDISATLKELTRVNSINTKLTEQALAFVNYNLNLLTRRQAENTYAPVGTAHISRATAALLDRKV